MPPDLYCVIPPDFDEMELLHQIRWIGRYGDNSPENAWYQHVAGDNEEDKAYLEAANYRVAIIRVEIQEVQDGE